MTTEHDRDDAPLPGLGPEPTQVGGVGEVERAARRTLAALQAGGLVSERHAVAMQTLITLARQLDRAANDRRAKDYGVANVAAQLQACYSLLIPDQDGGDSDDAFAQLAADLREAAARHGLGPSPTE